MKIEIFDSGHELNHHTNNNRTYIHAQTNYKHLQNSTMAYTVTVSNAQMKKAYGAFCNGWIDALTSETGPLEARHADLLRESLAERLQEVGKKTPKKAAGKSPKKKSPKKAKKATPKGPSKRELKVKELQNELKTTYGIESTTATVSELRKEIAAAKKAQKAEAKEAKTAEKAAKAASKPKKAAAAGTPPMSKRELKKMELFAELKTLGGDLPEDKPICDYTIKEIRAAIKAVTPKKKKGKKATSPKKPVVKKTQKDLIAELVGAPKTVELVGECTIGSITTFTGGSNGEVVATTITPAAAAAAAVPKEESKETPTVEFEDGELEEEEIDEDELVIEDDSDDEAEFPGMDRVEEFEHESRPCETLYKDEEGFIWNDEQEVVGLYDEDEDCIVEE